MKFPVMARDVVFRSFRSRRLWLLQLFANPALFLLFAAWLLIPVAKSWQLAANVLLALVLLAGVLVLHGGTIRYLHDRDEAPDHPFRTAFVGALRNFLPILIFAAIIYFFWTLLGRLDAYEETFPAYLRSLLPAFARRHLTLPMMNSLFAAALFVLRWIVIPGLFLPFVVQAAKNGFRVFSKAGFLSWGKSVWSLSYWVLLAVAAVIGVLGPTWLVNATPDFKTSTYRLEMSSLIVRLFVAYVLGLFAWMFACSLAGRNPQRAD